MIMFLGTDGGLAIVILPDWLPFSFISCFTVLWSLVLLLSQPQVRGKAMGDKSVGVKSYHSYFSGEDHLS